MTLTLCEFYKKHFLPMYCIGNRVATFAEYKCTLNIWKRLTSDPLLTDLSIETLAAFRQKLSVGRAAPTVNKHLRHVNAILAKVGPPGPRNRDALGLLPQVPWVKPLKTLKKLPRRVKLTLISRMYSACKHARRPNENAAEWWRCLLVMAYTTAFRKSALLALTWDNIDIANRTVRLSAEHDKAGCERVKPLCSTAVRHLLAIRSTSSPEVFPWSHGDKGILCGLGLRL